MSADPTSDHYIGSIDRANPTEEETASVPTPIRQQGGLRLVGGRHWGPIVMPESQFTVDAGLEREFKALAQEWRNRTAHLSLSNEQANNFAYHQIMAMGRDALPLIFQELETSATSGWIWALNAITRGKGPTIKQEDKGNVRSVVAAWLEWGKDNGYVRR